MATKKTKETSAKKTKKKKEEPVEIATDFVSENPMPSEEELERMEEANMNSINMAYEVIMNSMVPMNEGRINEARAINVLRMEEIKRSQDDEIALNLSFAQAKEYVYKILFRVAMENGLRYCDISLLCQMLSNDSLGLSLWEYNNIELSNKMLGVPDTPSPEDAQKMIDIWNSMGKKMSEVQDDDDGTEE